MNHSIVLSDVRAVFRATSVAQLDLPGLAIELTQRWPRRWSNPSSALLGAMLREAGLDPRSVRIGTRTAKGVRRKDVMAVAPPRPTIEDIDRLGDAWIEMICPTCWRRLTDGRA